MGNFAKVLAVADPSAACEKEANASEIPSDKTNAIFIGRNVTRGVKILSVCGN